MFKWSTFHIQDLESGASQQVMRKDLWLMTQRRCHANHYVMRKLKKAQDTNMGGAECLYQWTTASLRDALSERGSVFLY